MTDKVTIVSTAHGGCVVHPGHRTVDEGGIVEFRNRTGGEIVFSFPDSTLWATAPNTTLGDKASSSGTLASTLADASYVYSVYCKVGKEYAEGNSHPAFIVR